jgi:ribosomal protein L34E
MPFRAARAERGQRNTIAKSPARSSKTSFKKTFSNFARCAGHSRALASVN